MVTDRKTKQIEKKTKRPKPPTIGSLGDLLRLAYEGKFKRRSLKESEMGHIRSATEIGATQRKALLKLAASDQTLDRTKDLLLLEMSTGFDTAGLGDQFRSFIKDVLRFHPAFATDTLADVLENPPDTLSEENGVDTLVDQTFESLVWPQGVAGLTKAQAEQCKANSLYCLLLWFRHSRNMPLDRFQHFLHTKLWGPAVNKHESEADKISALVTIREPSSAAVACDNLNRQLAEQKQHAADARRSQERLEVRVGELEKDTSNLNSQLRAVQKELKSLVAELAKVTIKYRDEKSQLRFEYEKLRRRIRRRLEEEISLLDEGLQALQRSDPEIPVMVAHAKHAISDLKQEMARLEGEG